MARNLGAGYLSASLQRQLLAGARGRCPAADAFRAQAVQQLNRARTGRCLPSRPNNAPSWALNVQLALLFPEPPQALTTEAVTIEEINKMAEIITAVYASADTLPNVRNDLVSVGIPQEKIRVDHDKKQVQVMSPTTAEAEIEEILKRHLPTDIHTS